MSQEAAPYGILAVYGGEPAGDLRFSRESAHTIYEQVCKQAVIMSPYNLPLHVSNVEIIGDAHAGYVRCRLIEFTSDELKAWQRERVE